MSGQKPEWITQMNELDARWSTFLTKLEERMVEMAEAAIPELQEVFESDKGTYFNLLAGIKGQLNVLEDKVRDVYEEQIESFYDEISDDLDDDEWEEVLDRFRDKCSEGQEAFEEKVDAWRERLENTESVDLEAKYKSILNEYEQIKDKFCCKQCGSPISIPEMLFITTHVACPACQSQNTFEPSSQARELDFVGRALAEQRTQPLLDAHQAEEERERELYMQIHELSFEDETPSILAQIAELEQKRKDSIRNAPELYKKYLKAMFDEWIKLVPGLAEQNRKIYESRLKELD